MSVTWQIEGNVTLDAVRGVARVQVRVTFPDGSVRREIVDLNAAGATREERIAAAKEDLRERIRVWEHARRAAIMPAPQSIATPAELAGEQTEDVP